MTLKNNPYWETVKRKVKIRDGFKCVLCNVTAPLEIHHITYYVDGKNIIGNELDYLEWMVTLCEGCHTDQHFIPNTPFNPRNPNKLNIKEFKK
tara:strand:+ start:8526 stop:8804 length:279 start_codon:yes stop_codon:yes gene_type:complete